MFAVTFYGPCDSSQDPTQRADSMCEVSGAPVEANLDRWVSLLGSTSLVQRTALPGVEHMVQEFAPDAVIGALTALLAAHADP